jgi:hypothetical protein
MRKIFFFILAFMIFLTACSVGKNCFSIIYTNNSDKDATFTYGNYQIYVLKGTSVTYYYLVEDKKAKISLNKDVPVENFYYFHTYPGNSIIDDGKIVTGYEQLFNFQYEFVLRAENGVYKWYIKANYTGNKTDDITYPKYLF